ncbi:MAG: Gfo/Idh/MocA family oxidoreductase [Sedimentisphaerales bacterium]|nr:Gfo/Idh/MocA family oxidoreductase [Sedimentisphaerales bacterium]
MNGTKFRITRRQFLGTTAAATTAFTIIPRHVLGGTGSKAPSDKLNIAGVGIGGKGYSDLTSVESENIVALCDVDWRHASGAARRFPDARKWQDFRKMLDEQKEIDAVITATPDHLHAVVSMEAMKRGKHIFTQKPLTHTVYEARALAEAAQKYNVASQMGNQGQAGEETRLLREMIWDGAIGAIREVHVWTDRPNRGFTDVYWPQGVGRPMDTPPVPEGLDWDLFLGPAPVRPYHPAYHPFRWRGWWDFGTGALGDIGCHSLDPIFRAMKLGHPLTVQAVSTLVNRETYPSGSIVKYEFPARGDMPAVTLTWYDGGMKPFRPEELEEGRQLGTNGTLFVGDKGKILDGRIIPESKQKEYTMPPKSLPRSPGHYEEWITACKGGEPAGSNFSFAGPLTEVVLLGNIALRLELKEKVSRLKLQWDPENLKITNLPEANQFLHVEYRKGWTL